MIEQFVSTGKWWIVFLEIVPGFGLYRALFAISQWAFKASWQVRGPLPGARTILPRMSAQCMPPAALASANSLDSWMM